MKRHLLPCTCSRRIEVTPAQAGGTVRCPGCGLELAVPRLGDLARLEAVSDAAASATPRGWGPAQAGLLAGVVIAAGAATTAGWLHVRRTDVAPIDEAVIMQSVATAPAERVYEAWLNYERQGIARPPQAVEQRRTRQAESLATLERIAWAVSAVGTALAAVAALLIVARRG